MYKQGDYIIFKLFSNYIYHCQYKFKKCEPYRVNSVKNDIVFIIDDIGNTVMFGNDELKSLCINLTDFL